MCIKDFLKIKLDLEIIAYSYVDIGKRIGLASIPLTQFSPVTACYTSSALSQSGY